MAMDISYRNLLRIALPVCLGAFVQFILVFTDNFFLGKLGMNEMNGAAMVGLVYLTLAIIGVGLGGGTQILVARRTGEKNFERGGRTLANAFYLSLIIAVILFVLLYFVCPFFFNSWMKSQEIRGIMARFLDIRAWGVFFFVPAAVLNGFFVGISRPKIIAVSTGAAAIVNVLLCWLLVFGRAGFPQMGVEGAATATLISEFIGLVIILAYTFRSKFSAIYSIPHAFSTASFKDSPALLRISGPMMLQLLLSLAIWTIFFVFVEKLGEKQMQASHIIRSMYLLALISTMGFSQTTRTVVSTLMAENRLGDIKPALVRLAVLNFAGIVLLVHGLLLYPAAVAELFTKDPETIGYTVKCMAVVFPAMLISSVSSILLNTVEGSGNTLPGFLVELGTSVFYFTFAWWVTVVHPMPVHFAWMADWVYFGCIGLFAGLYLKFSNWRHTRV